MSDRAAAEPAAGDGPDRLSWLPDAVLVSILSLLPLRDAVRTSVLSIRWRRLWLHVSDLLLDADNLLPPGLRFPDAHLYDLYKDSRDRLLLECTRRFLAAADSLVRRHEAPTLATFRLHFPLARPHAAFLDAWIGRAAARGAQVLDLDFNRGRPIIPFDPPTDPYAFPFHFFSGAGAAAAAALRRLSLVFVSWAPPAAFSGFRSLTDLELRSVRFFPKSEEALFQGCPALERLVLAKCENLVDLRVQTSSLRYLWLEDWQSLKTVRLRAPNLSVFEYKGRNVTFLFEEVPSLERLFLWEHSLVRMMKYVVHELPSEVPQIKALTLCLPSPREVQCAYLDGRIPRNPSRFFLDLRQLTVSIRGRGPLLWVAVLFRAAPFLRNLQLHMIFHWDTERLRLEDQIEQCHHHHLETVEITGFTGSSFQLDLAKFVLVNAVNLESLRIDPYPIQYLGDGKWAAAPDANLEERIQEWDRWHRTITRLQLSGEMRPHTRLITV